MLILGNQGEESIGSLSTIFTLSHNTKIKF